MKYIIVFTLLFLSGLNHLNAQSVPVWTRDMNALPDSTPIYPVRILNDQDNNVLVLSSYYKGQSSVYKIYLKKFSQAGALLWTLIYDHNGSGDARAYDMALDVHGNAYIGGGFVSPPYRPLLLKVDNAGKVSWIRDSSMTSSFGYFSHVLSRNGDVYAGGNGLVNFDTSGNEKWSKNMLVSRMAVDGRGHLVVCGTDTSGKVLHGFDKSGKRKFTDTLLLGKRMAFDQYNNLYILADLPSYELLKYDSSGTFKWGKTTFPKPNPFGDIGFEVLTDYEDNVIVAGLGDSLFKFSPGGQLKWGRSMKGLDAYRIVVTLTNDNHIAIAGSPDNGGYYMKVATFNIDGKINWYGTFNSQSVLQEFTVDMAIDNSGIYVVENNNQNGTLVKFGHPVFLPPDYGLLCVDSVWYDPSLPGMVNVRLFNGSVGGFNYPSVRMVAPNGDTISNKAKKVDFFLHVANSYLVYHDTISKAGITDFSNYKFLFGAGFSDTTVSIQWCSTLGVRHAEPATLFRIFPNPFHDGFYIETARAGMSFKLYDANGRLLIEKQLDDHTEISGLDLPAGLYFYSITSSSGIIGTGKMISR